MTWKCPYCGNDNEVVDESCLVCNAEKPETRLVTLTKTVVEQLYLGGEVLIPVDYNVIGENAFKDRTDVTCVILHENVKKILKGAFSGCINLTEIRSDAMDIETISTKAFYNCTSLPADQQIAAAYVAEDAYGNTLEDLMKVSTEVDENDVGDVELTANESFIADLPSFSKIGIKRSVGDGDVENSPILLDKDFAVTKSKPAVDVEVKSTADADYTLSSVDGGKYNPTVNKKISELCIKRKLHQIFVDCGFVAFGVLALCTLFFFIASQVGLFESAKSCFLASTGLAVPFLIYFLFGLLGIKIGKIAVGNVCCSIFGVILAGFAIYLSFVYKDYALMAITASFGIFATAGLNAITWCKDGGSSNDYVFIFCMIAGGSGLLSICHGLITYLIG